MSEKRPLEAMEEMVHKLPPVNKKRKRKETKIQPPTSTVDQEDALANLLDDLITTDPQTTHPQKNQKRSASLQNNNKMS